MYNLALKNPLNPVVHFWLHHTAHCTEKMSRKGGTGEVGRVTRRSHAHGGC